jgi:DNA transposition AAA+ family ATPase
MTDERARQNDAAFSGLADAERIAQGARMLSEETKLSPNQRKDIVERFLIFIEEHGLAQKTVEVKLGWSSGTVSRLIGHGKQSPSEQRVNRAYVQLNNWMELTARQENVLQRKDFVETTVARDILAVAGLVAECCKMGVVFGPAQIGKSMTLQAIEGDPRFGSPVIVRVDESLIRPLPLCRAVARAFKLKVSGPFDVVMHGLVSRLLGTKRMICFDEVERVKYRTLEWIRDLHDRTGCPVLLCGKPSIYERMGFRHAGDFSEVTDQLSARIVVRRDLTERTRGDHPRPLYTIEDIRALIAKADLKIHVSPDAERWLQSRASSLGMGGLGIAMSALYLAYKIAWVKGDQAITADHLAQVVDVTVGSEDAARMAEVVAQSSGLRRVV